MRLISCSGSTKERSRASAVMSSTWSFTTIAPAVHRGVTRHYDMWMRNVQHRLALPIRAALRAPVLHVMRAPNRQLSRRYDRPMRPLRAVLVFLAALTCVTAIAPTLRQLLRTASGACPGDRLSRPCADAADQPAALAPAQINAGGAVIGIEFAPGHFDLARAQLIQWVAAASRAVVDYYGRFPVDHARVRIEPIKGRRGVGEGTTWGTHGAFTRIYLGETTRDSDLRDDWVMTHEMVHYAFPSVSRDHHWIEEGIATYVEPIARMEAGEYSVTRVWGDLVEGLPKGLPAPDDHGLDYTHTWGRTYWGGAFFCLLADVRIRRQDRKS